MQKTLKGRFLQLLLIFFICVGCIVPANAYELVYIQTSIDPVQWEIVSSVLHSNVGALHHSPEFRRIPDSDLNKLAAGGNYIGEFNNKLGILKDDEGNVRNDVGIANDIAQAGIFNNFGLGLETNRILSFPTNQVKRDDSTPEQYQEAMKINNTLILGLNQAFNAYMTEKGYPKSDDAGAYMDKMLEFLNYCSASDEVTDDEYIFEDNGKEVTVKWKMQKSDGKWISWGAIVYEAFYNYCLEGEEAVTVNNVYNDKSSDNVFISIITGFFSILLDGIHSLLGLWTLDELIFNQNLRGLSYIGGIFPSSWESTIWTLFSVFEIFGAAMIMVGIIISVVHKLLSTTNFIERMHLMEKIQDLIICAIILALLPFALRVLLSFSNSLTQICSSMVPGAETNNPKEIKSLVRRFTSSNGALAGVLGQFVYLGLEIYFNFYYAIRTFSVPVLIIMSPFFVCGICLSSGKKQLAIQWSKELLSFIFMQPIHAFLIALLLFLQPSFHAFDNIIFLYAIIPLSQTIKSLVFGQTSGFAERTAERAKNVATGLTAAAGIGALTAGAKGVGSLISAAKAGGGGSNGSSGNDSSGGGDPGSDGSSGSPGPMGNASTNGIFKNVAGKVKSGASKVGHKIANSKLGQGVAKAANTKIGRGVRTTGRAVKKIAVNPVTKAGTKLALGMALGAAGGVIGSTGGRDFGRMTSDLGSSVIAGRNINKKDDNSNQNSESSNSEPENAMENDSVENVSPPDLNAGGIRDADDFINDKRMEVRNYNQSDLNKMGISDANYERGNLKFTSSGDSPQAQDLRAYAQYLDNLPEEQMKEEIERRGINATQDGDYTRVRINTKAWSAANDGAKIDGYTNKKGDSSIQVSSPKGGVHPSFTGGQIMNVNPAEIKGYQTMLRPVKDKDGTIRQEKVGQIPLENMTSTQRGVIASGAGVTRDEKNMYVPLNANGSPSNYVKKVSFSARDRHIQESQELAKRKLPETQINEGGNRDFSTKGRNGDVQQSSANEQAFQNKPTPKEPPSGFEESAPAGPPVSQTSPTSIEPSQSESKEPPTDRTQPESDDSAAESPQFDSQEPSSDQSEPVEVPTEQPNSKADRAIDEYAYSELPNDDLSQELDEIDFSDLPDDFSE